MEVLIAFLISSYAFWLFRKLIKKTKNTSCGDCPLKSHCNVQPCQREKNID
ncbi:FeoB-associated Cys-rich membrane protein [Amphibacillus jilinensis]|uniref:FeoB-associated Cys-rich membrane protein n=1 Tax=Amphibacillus jilinensis TaxID=1216008 RepID=UPI00036125EC